MLKALLDKRGGLVAGMRAILEAAEAEDRDLTAEEQATYDGHKAEKDALDKRIARLTDLEASTAAGTAFETAVVPAASRRAGPEPVRAGGDAVREFSSLGEFMHAVRFRPSDQRLSWVENSAAGGDGELVGEGAAACSSPCGARARRRHGAAGR